MKRIINLSILALTFLVCMPTQAQFFKKLGKKVQDAAEDKVLDKSAKKTSKSVDEGMDDIFSIGKDKGKKNKSKSTASPRNSYTFPYFYVMNFEFGNGNDSNQRDLEMFLTESGEYLGIRASESGADMFMVMDYSKSASFNFMSSSSGKMMFPVSIDVNDEGEDDYDNSDFKITSLPDKTFLGYNCKGKKLENQEWEIKLYYTDEVPVSMSSMTKGGNEKMTKMFQQEGMDITNGLVMYMEGENKQDKDESYIMTAKKLEKVDCKFKTAGYQQISSGM